MRNDVDDAASLSLSLPAENGRKGKEIDSFTHPPSTDATGLPCGRNGSRVWRPTPKVLRLWDTLWEVGAAGPCIVQSVYNTSSFCVCVETRVLRHRCSTSSRHCAQTSSPCAAPQGEIRMRVSSAAEQATWKIFISRDASLSLFLSDICSFFFKYIYKFSTPSTPVISYRCQGPLRCRPPKQT